MKMTAKIALFSAAIVTMGSLAACQSTTQPPKPEHGMMQDGPREGHHRMKHREFTPEQKAAWEQHRAERQARFEQIQKACDGKANGQPVSVQIGGMRFRHRFYKLKEPQLLTTMIVSRSGGFVVNMTLQYNSILSMNMPLLIFHRKLHRPIKILFLVMRN